MTTCRYEWVFALKRDFPHLEFSLNGGLGSSQQAAAALQHSVDGASIHGVMIGRAAYNHPWACLADADVAVFGAAENAATSRREVPHGSLLAVLPDVIYQQLMPGWKPCSGKKRWQT